MKVVICMPTLCPWSRSIALTLQRAGNEVHVFDIVRREERGLISTSIPGVLKDFDILKRGVSGVHYARSHMHHRLQYFAVAPQLRSLCRSLDADIILTLSGAGYYSMAYLSGIRPFVAYAVGSDILLAGNLQRLMNRQALSSAATVFANGEYLTEKTRLQVPKARVMNLLLGVDLDRFHLTSFDTRPIGIVCTRGFEHVYDNETIVRALSLLPSSLPDFRMVFVSGGELLRQCRALADSILPALIRERVEFWGGVAYRDVVTCLEHSHIFLSMSRSDGTATALLEAMACGLFPIISEIPQNRPFISREIGNGVLVPTGDAAALAHALTKALSQVDELGSFSSYNRKLIAELADATRNRQLLISVMKEIVNGL